MNRSNCAYLASKAKLHPVLLAQVLLLFLFVGISPTLAVTRAVNKLVADDFRAVSPVASALLLTKACGSQRRCLEEPKSLDEFRHMKINVQAKAIALPLLLPRALPLRHLPFNVMARVSSQEAGYLRRDAV